MFGLKGLHSKVASYMAWMVLGGLAITTLGWTFIYALFTDAPDAEAVKFHPADYLALAIFGTLGLLVAIAAAANLSKRIVTPVTSVAAAARRLAHGDLTARASIEDTSMGEVVDLAHDFNLMAVRLEELATEAAQWNAAIAHELRTPLTVLRGSLQGVSDGLFTMDEGLLRSLLSQVESLSRLVEDLRTLSLADSGHLYLRRSSVPLARVVTNMRAFMEAPLRKAGFDVEWIVENVVVEADETRVGQALLALLENARIHAVKGRLQVRLHQEGDDAVLSVSDDGPGIPPDAAPAMFEPFTGASAGVNGSGLGLAVVRGIAEAHGGIARHRPSGRGGSTFEILLPLRAAD